MPPWYWLNNSLTTNSSLNVFAAISILTFSLVLTNKLDTVTMYRLGGVDVVLGSVLNSHIASTSPLKSGMLKSWKFVVSFI